MRVPHPSLISFEYVVENVPEDELDAQQQQQTPWVEHPGAAGMMPPPPAQYQVSRASAMPPDALFYQR